MRIGDWSSDVCSSDLQADAVRRAVDAGADIVVAQGPCLSRLRERGVSRRPLALFIGTTAHDRLHAALSLAPASAALGRRVALSLHAGAVLFVAPANACAHGALFAPTRRRAERRSLRV